MEWEKYSPGKISAKLIMVYENRIQVFDFTIGSENYKRMV